MIVNQVKKTLLYSELNEVDRKSFFDLRNQKFVHNIDSFYLVIKVENDWNTDINCRQFVNYLDEKKYQCHTLHEPVLLFQENVYNQKISSEFFSNGIGSYPYLYDIDKKDKYISFIAFKAMNEKTPEIWVQIRSEFLWLYGVYHAVKEVMNDFERILNVFGIKILEVTENRIDYAYHTNYIQNPLTFFDEKKQNMMQESRFTRSSKEYEFVGQFDVESDYFTLGRKKSNNYFVRAYNKTKEVIQKGYKQFFLKIWHMEKLINYFDFYCIEKAFQKGSYEYVDVARLLFYLEVGKDEEIKLEINNLINVKQYDYEKIRNFAKGLVPEVTIVVNFEIETRRKFYYSLDSAIFEYLEVKTCNVPLYSKKIYLILDNLQVFHNFITRNTPDCSGLIRFIDYKAKNKFGKPWTRKSKFPTAGWWKRLQSVKVNREIVDNDVLLYREYQKSLDVEKMKKRAVNTLSTLSLYLNKENKNEIQYDALDLLSSLNENDIRDAKDYKEKKSSLLKNRLDELNSTEVDRNYNLVDKETGELLE